MPQPATLGGIPSSDGTTIMITKDGLAELARYLIGIRAWIAAAQVCLDSRLFEAPAAAANGRVVKLCGMHCN